MAEEVTFELAIGQQLLLRPWVSILHDYHLDLVLRDDLYYLHGNAYVNLLEQVVNAIGSERSRIEISLKYMRTLRLSRIGEEIINKLKKYELGLIDS